MCNRVLEAGTGIEAREVLVLSQVQVKKPSLAHRAFVPDEKINSGSAIHVAVQEERKRGKGSSTFSSHLVLASSSAQTSERYGRAGSPRTVQAVGKP